MIDGYLQKVRDGLKGLPAEEAQDILDELRSHLEDQAAEQGPEAAVAAMGDPRELAGLYLAERMAARVETSRSPWLILGAAYRLAGLSVDAFFTFLGAALGYAVGFGLILSALLKPFLPGRVGLWVQNGDDFSFSFGMTANPVGEELLGWWIIPIGLIAGALVSFVTWRLSLAGVRRLGRARTALFARRAG